MLQSFVFNDNTRETKEVLKQKSKRCLTMTIQISEVRQNYLGRVRYIYEEINNYEDSVIYCHYVSKKTVLNRYPWFFEK